MRDLFLTADWHLFHPRILNACNRPFSSVEENTEVIIQNVNNLPKDSILYNLGDLTCLNNRDDGIKEQIESVLNMIRPDIKVYIVGGNHDPEIPYINLKKENRIQNYRLATMLKIGVDKIFLSHFPHLRWHCCHYGSFHAFGHEHGTLEHEFGRSADVGVDNCNFKPIHVEDFMKRLRDRSNNGFYESQKFTDL
jgi:calcineurin-like phosphoesterase family protein